MSDARRIAACVSACKGWDTETLEAFAADPDAPSLPNALAVEVNRSIALTAERDAAVADARELYAALVPIANIAHRWAHENTPRDKCFKAPCDSITQFIDRLAAKYGQEAKQ